MFVVPEDLVEDKAKLRLTFSAFPSTPPLPFYILQTLSQRLEADLDAHLYSCGHHGAFDRCLSSDGSVKEKWVSFPCVFAFVCSFHDSSFFVGLLFVVFVEDASGRKG